ncbi:hypothetical protein BDW22DRAFT_428588 [Trametopsis cervina]|nr:hypothetical protein BDW22DRAFT_428588 [Trametopsis cervina]
MLRSLSRIFQGTPTNSDAELPPALSSHSQKESPHTASIRNDEDHENGIGTKPLPLQPHSLARTASFPSSLTLDRARNGPSHVSWITGTNTPSATGSGSPSLAPSPIRPFTRSNASLDGSTGRSPNTAPSQIDINGTPILRDGIWRFPPAVANAVLGPGGGGGTDGSSSYRISGGRMSSDGGSVHLQSVYLSDTDTNSLVSSAGEAAGGGVLGGTTSRPLSRIDESGQSPNESVPGTDKTNDTAVPPTPTSCTPATPTPTQPPITPSSNPFATPNQTPTTLQPQAFLTRPLKRSISRDSTSTTTGTFLTPTSAIPPSLLSTTASQTHAHGHSPIPHSPVSASTPTANLSSSVLPNNNYRIVHGNGTHGVPGATAPTIPPVDVRPSFSNSLPLSVPYPISTRRTYLAAPPSLPTVLGSPTPRTQPLPALSTGPTGLDVNYHTHVSTIYEQADSVMQRDSVATGRWRDSGKSVSFVTAPSVHFSEPGDENEEEEEEDDVGQYQHEGSERDNGSSSFEEIRPPEQDEYLAYLAQHKTAYGERDVGDGEEGSGYPGDSRSHMSLPEGYCDMEPAPPSSTAVEHQIQNAPSHISRTASWTSTFLYEGTGRSAAGHHYSQDTAVMPGEESRNKYAFDGSEAGYPPRSNGSILETISRHSIASGEAASDVTMVERAIDRRWFQAREVSWGSFRSFRDSIYLVTHGRKRQTDEKMKDLESGIGDDAGDGWRHGRRGGADSERTPPSAACILFFLGFIAPWCWLIGGWYLSARNGGVKESESQLSLSTTDREAGEWPRRTIAPRKQRKPTKQQDEESSGWKSRVRAWRALGRGGQSKPATTHNGHVDTGHTEDAETTPMSPADGPDSHASMNALYSFHLSPTGSVVRTKNMALDSGNEKVVHAPVKVDRWVYRCRVGSVITGLALVIVIVAVVVYETR